MTSGGSVQLFFNRQPDPTGGKIIVPHPTFQSRMASTRSAIYGDTNSRVPVPSPPRSGEKVAEGRLRGLDARGIQSELIPAAASLNTRRFSSRRVREVGFIQVVRCASRIAHRPECSLRHAQFADVTHQRVSTCFTHPTLIVSNPGSTPSRRRRMRDLRFSETGGSVERLDIGHRHSFQRFCELCLLDTKAHGIMRDSGNADGGIRRVLRCGNGIWELRNCDSSQILLRRKLARELRRRCEQTWSETGRETVLPRR